MKHFPIKRSKTRRMARILEIRPHLRKPTIPKIVFWNAHKVDNVYLGWNEISLSDSNRSNQSPVSFE
jgi:hypothetical protein